MFELQSFKKSSCCLAVAILLAGAGPALAHDVADVAGPTSRPTAAQLARVSEQMATAATNLWNALTPEQQKTLVYEFNDDAERHNFQFVPRPRKGLPWTQMTTTQRHLAYALLATGLSQRTYGEALTIMSLEEILAEIEKGRGPKRDPENYYFTVFGKPDAKGTWGWKFEGHHVALNFTIVDGKGIAGAPAFLGANPAEVREGPRKGLRALTSEEDIGFKLIRSLDEGQRKKAIISEKPPGNIVTGTDRKVGIGEPKGIAYGELSVEQQAMVRILVNVYAHRLRDELAHQDIATIEQAGWDKVRFAWAGGTEPGIGHYYRIHGPTFLAEFDNTQNGANHLHTVWRDLLNDFGEDLLKKHYEQDHAGAK